MQKLRHWIGAFGLAMLAAPAFAAPSVDQIVAQLKRQGYTEVEVERTWLGRIRIEAENETRVREIILNRRTGEILRDYWYYHLETDEDDEDEEEHGLIEHEEEESEDDGDDSEDEEGGDDD